MKKNVFWGKTLFVNIFAIFDKNKMWTIVHSEAYLI
jgi:hypothetical protein